MNGIVLVNKPSGYTSRDIVNIVGKKLKTKKIGHTGTLDPMATGVLILCVGKATKLVQILSSDTKEYVAGITLGLLTDTLDIEGNILKEENIYIDKEKIKTAINSLKGKYIQEVPIYSAVKVNGKKLYEYARENKKVELPKREVEIFDIKLIDEPIYKDNKIYFNIKCKVSKGTYIRSLAYDIAKKLNTIGIMNSLNRIKQGNIDINMCQTLKDIEEDNYALLPINYILNDYYEVKMDEKLYFKIKNGVSIDNIYGNDIIKFTYNNEVIALYKNVNNKLKCYIMLNND